MQVYKTNTPPQNFNAKHSSARQITIKLFKVRDKERILKGVKKIIFLIQRKLHKAIYQLCLSQRPCKSVENGMIHLSIPQLMDRL